MSSSEQLKKLEREGAEGRWEIYEETHHEPSDDPKYTERWILDNGVILNFGDGDIPLGPARLIVSLRNALPQLLALIEAAEYVRDSWLIIESDDAHLMNSCAKLDLAISALDKALS